MADAEGHWPRGGGEIGAQLRSPGYALPGLGAVDTWPDQLKSLVELVLAAPHRAFLTWGPDYLFFYNDMILRDYRAIHDQMFGLSYRDNLPELWAVVGHHFERGWSGEAVLVEGLHARSRRTADGEPADIWVDLSMSPVRGPAGEMVALYGLSIDQTARVTAAAALDEQRDMLEIVNRAGSAITGELDTAIVAQTAVDAGVALTGAQFGAFFYNVNDAEGESYMLYAIAGVDRSEFDKFPMPRNTQVFAPTFEGQGIVRVDDITADPRYGHNAPHRGMPEGHLPVRSYLAVPVKTPSGAVIGGLFFGHSEPGIFSAMAEASLASLAGQAALAMDNARLFAEKQREIIRRGEAEEKLRKANEALAGQVRIESGGRQAAEAALAQAQKMETIGKLTGGVAHDFNNLLQVISGNLQLLTHDVKGNPRGEKRVTNALAGVARGSKLASQLLAFGRRQPLEPRVLNIGKFVAGMEDMLRRALGEAVELEVVVSGGLWNTMADPAQIENAILNLAINARDAMEGSGKLTIEAGNASLDDAYVRDLGDVAAGQYVMLAVTDTGEGMTREVIEQAFEPFFSTKAEGKGSGLGLSMVYGFVKQSGGHVRLYSEPGMGTTVKLYLPRVHRPEEQVVVVDDAPVEGGTETILVAEDDAEVRSTVTELLGELGYRVLKAVDAQSALNVIDSGVPIDLLFTDVVMPGTLKSPELARLARQRQPDIAVLFTSGYTENAIVHDGKLDVGVDLLSKPYTREALARKVRAVLGKKRQQ